MKVYFFILLLFSIKFDIVSSKYAIGNIDEDFQERIAEAIHDQNDTDDSIAKLQRIKQILKDVLSLEVSKKSQMEVDVSADGSVTTPSESYQQPKTCSSYLGCEECVSHSCGWCIANRSCKEDAAWQCLGEHDHVGLSGIGRYKTCPSTKEMDEMRATRRKRKLEAKSSPQKEDDISSSDSSSTASEDSAAPLSKDEKTKELLRRAELAKENYGLAHPYETLGVPVTASGGEIRKAYRKLSLLYHPDKNPGDENADSAFKDIVNAFEILGDPEKREYYDDMGSSNMEAFNTMEDYLRFGKKNEGNFYQGSKLITPLTESMWERRVGSGNTIWLVEFYAPWCGHCQTKIPIFKKIAEMLEDEENIEVGAVNCATQNVICHQWFGIPEFPSLLALNDYHGMRQEYRGDFQPEPVIAWLKTVEKEWKWLMHSSNLIEINSIKHFNKQVMSSDEFWIVVYMDGFDCISCQTAKTNAMRLSASLRGYTGIKIGIVNCEDKSANALCYKDQGLPSRPHAPVVKGYSTGPKGTNRQGEVLYNTNEVEQHIALELLERTVRLSLADKILETDALVSENEASTSGYEKDKPKKEDKKPPERPQQPLWNGPKRRDPVGWGGGGFHEVPRGFRLQ